MGLIFWRAEFALVLLGAVAGLGGAIFQISAAYHAKVSHFLECFSRCNEAYAKLNGRLREPLRPSQKREHPPAADGPNDAIVDYFNLCAEEYLMYKMGVIPEFVWRVWCDGIHARACADHIKKAWDEEKRWDYYGWDLKRLMRQYHDEHIHNCSNRLTCLWNTREFG